MQVKTILHCIIHHVYVCAILCSHAHQIKVDDDGKIVDARFKTFGCGSAIASSSLATEWVKGRTVSHLRMVPNHSYPFVEWDY
jgi:hypothetical protein